MTRRVDSQEVFGLTSPLITTASGAKMGKTAGGAIWLNEDRLSAFDFWQFWRNTEDADVGRFLRLFTELPMDEVKRLEALAGAEINDAKIILANEVTKLCHGEQASATAAETARQTFAAGKMADGLPQIEMSADEVDGLSILDAFIRTDLAKSKGEVRRLIKGGGARLNNAAIQSDEAVLSLDDFADEQRCQLSSGKKRHALIILSS